MIAFADLLERLVFTPGRLAKIALLRRYFETAPDPDRGYGLAALTDELEFQAAKPGMIKDLCEARTDPVLFAWSRDYVGDLAETVSLLWPARRTNAGPPTITEIVDTLRTTPKADLPDIVANWLDASTVSIRYATIKLITGSLRVGASSRLAKTALAELAADHATPVAADDIEELWHGLAPPYAPLFAWLEGHGPKPDPAGQPIFRPLMLAQPLEPADIAALDPALFRAEWKWDGIRVQLVSTALGKRIYSRGADDISATFPEIVAAMPDDVVLDGELLVIRDEEIAPFADLQQRLNRKSPGPKMQKDFPVGIRLYDILFDGPEDVRPLPFDQRRQRLESWFAATQPPRMTLSTLIPFASMAELGEVRAGTRAASIEGLMLKRADSRLSSPAAPRASGGSGSATPLIIDAVMMYAQRGSGKRSSFYSDYTFGLWTESGDLVPVGKAYSGFTDAELVTLDRWIRNHTTSRFGPVREVERSYVLEIEFDAAQRSNRHKSGVALRFPRVHRLRPDKPAEEADRLETLLKLIV